MNVYSSRLYIDAADPLRVERPLLIEAGDVQIDAMGSYCGTSGTLLSVSINGNLWEPHSLRVWLNPLARDHMGAWDGALTAEEIEEAAQ